MMAGMLWRMSLMRPVCLIIELTERSRVRESGSGTWCLCMKADKGRKVSRPFPMSQLRPCFLCLSRRDELVMSRAKQYPSTYS